MDSLRQNPPRKLIKIYTDGSGFLITLSGIYCTNDNHIHKTRAGPGIYENYSGRTGWHDMTSFRDSVYYKRADVIIKHPEGCLYGAIYDSVIKKNISIITNGFSK